ncbi:hypothetical protein A3A71_00505 [Candidatus Berkelbacteria bacterium RIFCSPLOWO2_01_FULL_50_28]|uniref:Membrane insertase YidC/Oxa/ALB C-terminal domain-containing protein n=1 Tax=Candidatus Berkelbacteria bacterium RIFCSPLOWO2_01_FULL_50_28 TaxID=1797471 RepID=A0A1F5EB84_9BACT|nr:MAG: hypothetical protein A3F39_02645 [Candidatus Berkelbacteria bacterium RIFCSPHIGHO2_12_FULL_50_11]OGD64526.1 MAG: hypothetical protein A3A71_00505 [Candidatus Berkelbacteria bacterium RIFCSPLOWO2_01_FULL_50_28]
MKEFFRIILYKPLFNLLMFFAWIVPGHSMGWAIIMLTILVNVVLWVPKSKSLRMPMLQAQYRDEIKALQDKYKDDRNTQAKMLMAFYKEKGINPMAGCLPLLIQLPILFILYKVFMVGLNTVRPDLIYSFTPHLNTINTLFFGIDLAKPEKIFLPIIAAALQFGQSYYQMKLTPPSGDKKDVSAMMSKQMMYMLPAITLFFGMTLPAGLMLYWGTSTGLSWLQQVQIARTFKAKPKTQVTVRTRRR